VTDDQPAAVSGAPVRGPERRRRLRWSDIAVPVLVELAVSVPTLLIEETWHGRPMIDERSALWVVPACIVAAAFLTGGAIAGYRRRSTAAAITATSTATLAVAVLLAADLVRRFWLVHEKLPRGVERLWYLGVAAALMMSAAGSQIGSRLGTRAWTHRPNR
jgi:hypothetical protein